MAFFWRGSLLHADSQRAVGAPHLLRVHKEAHRRRAHRAPQVDYRLLIASLPQRAGRAFAKLLLFTNRLQKYQAQTAPHLPTKSRKKGAPYGIRILSEVNPDIDPNELAKVLIDAASEHAREDRAS